MYVGNDFDPSDTGEDEIYEFNFTLRLATGETIQSAIWTCKVAAGTDPSPASHLQGSPATSPDGTRTQILIGGLIPSNKYLLEAMITTSLGQEKSLWSHVTCSDPV